MRLVSVTRLVKIGVLTLVGAGFQITAFSQLNSPYSRYGLGDVVPAQHVQSRGMGGLSAALQDVQSINFLNPASYSKLKVTTFDVGFDYTNRVLRESNSSNSFKSSYITPSYVQVGVPLSKKINWGMNLGLRPITRINYKIAQSRRLPDIDSVQYLYEGNGGSYQVYGGMGIGTRNLSVGVNVGYMFGNKEYTTRLAFINDSITYRKANYSDSTRFGSVFLQAGIQYSVELSKETFLRLGAYAQLQNNMNATRDITRETFDYDFSGGTFVIDSVYKENDIDGRITFPATYGAGFIIEKENKFLFGVDYVTTQWTNFRYYGEEDALQDSWRLNVGAQLIPNYTARGYWSRVSYRVGFWMGPDYIRISDNLPQYAFSLGFGLPVRRQAYTNQYTQIHTAFEYGVRGNRENALRESFFRVSVGLSLSDVWFLKPKYE